MAKEKKAKKATKKEKAVKIKPTKKALKALETFKQPEHKPMFHATCAECGKGFELPFKPTGERPVYCPVCFQTKKNTNLRAPQSKPNFTNRNADRKMYSATCAKCGQRCEVPFMPAPGKSIYCNACFSSNKSNRFGENRRDERPFRREENRNIGFNSNRPATQDNSQFTILNAKIDKLISGINALNAALATKEVEEKPVKKAKKK
ncbi:MAG: CxxC-x17-CxxC domain-containing protein [Parcubacteria group bacterium]